MPLNLLYTNLSLSLLHHPIYSPLPSSLPTMTAVCSDPGVWAALDSPLRPAVEDAPLPDLSPPPGVVV